MSTRALRAAGIRPLETPRWMPTRGALSGHVRRRRGSRRATVRAMEPGPRRLDLLAVALLVYFVALIVTVVALLVLPLIPG